MKTQIFCIALFLGAVFPAHTQPSLYYRMDSLSLLSDHIVLCEETDVRFTAGQNKSPFPTNAVVRCKVVQTFKGALKPDTELHAEYDASWARTLPGKQGYTVSDQDGQNIKTVQPEYAPAGQVLLFLKPRKRERVFIGKRRNRLGKVWHRRGEAHPGRPGIAVRCYYVLAYARRAVPREHQLASRQNVWTNATAGRFAHCFGESCHHGQARSHVSSSRLLKPWA